MEAVGLKRLIKGPKAGKVKGKQGAEKIGEKGKSKNKPKQEQTAEKQSAEQQGKKQDAKKAKGQEKQEKKVDLNNSQKRAIRSLEKQIEKHQQKIRDYISNPDQCDNKGFLKDKSIVEKARLMQERIDSLNHQISTFKKNINAIKSNSKK